MQWYVILKTTIAVDMNWLESHRINTDCILDLTSAFGLWIMNTEHAELQIDKLKVFLLTFSRQVPLKKSVSSTRHEKNLEHMPSKVCFFLSRIVQV